MSISQNNLKRFEEYLKSVALNSIYPPPDSNVIKTLCKRPTEPLLQSAKKSPLQQRIKEAHRLAGEPDDGRKRIERTTQWPFSVHGIVAFDFHNVRKWGTGTLIGPNIVLTAAHNLYDYESKIYANRKTVQFLPAVNGQQLPFGFAEVEQYFISPNYLKYKKEDYGILILKEPIGYETGYFGLACLEPEELQDKVINVYGYPYDKVASKPNTYEMWGMDGMISVIDTDQVEILSLIKTTSGQDGSSVWYRDGEDCYVCGVHGQASRVAHRATLMTRAIYKQIYQWISEISYENSLQFDNIEELALENYQIDAPCLLLLNKYRLNNLASLCLPSRNIGSDEVKIIAQNTSWTNLLKVDLSRNNISDEGAQALAQNNSWKFLSELNLSRNDIGHQGSRALAQNTSWVNLSKVDLSGNRIDDEGAQALSQNNSWKLLSELILSENDIGILGAKALAQNTSWVNLSKVDLSGNRIDDKGAQALAQNNPRKLVSELILSENDIGILRGEALAQNTSWINPSKVDLSGNRIDDKEDQALAQDNPRKLVSELIWGENDIGILRGEALAQKTSWKSLENLNLNKNELDGQGAEALAQNVSWKDLSELNLDENKISEEVSKMPPQIRTSKVNLEHYLMNKVNDEGRVRASDQNASWTNFSEWGLNENPTYSFEGSQRQEQSASQAYLIPSIDE